MFLTDIRPKAGATDSDRQKAHVAGLNPLFDVRKTSGSMSQPPRHIAAAHLQVDNLVQLMRCTESEDRAFWDARLRKHATFLAASRAITDRKANTGFKGAPDLDLAEAQRNWVVAGLLLEIGGSQRTLTDMSATHDYDIEDPDAY